ncbi:MAG TPA: type IV pilin protein [Steroidobacteraceae bacterium]|jgi:type IV pilus assembly protein PilE|nr:type IV pilin protein [Steroidobacteraceae bacterium]
MSVRNPLQRGFTLAEILTALVVIVVLAAIAIPMWRVHTLRVRRADATAALIAVQAAQDAWFGRHARYADGAQLTRAAPEGLGLKNQSERGFYDLELERREDGLGYVATARASGRAGQSDDMRCVEFSLDQNNRRRALDSEGKDRSADCWR